MNDEGALTNGELGRWLTRVETKIDHAVSDHESRIRRIERSMYVAIGLATAGVASGLSSLLAIFGRSA